jgi:hypothetical protein
LSTFAVRQNHVKDLGVWLKQAPIPEFKPQPHPQTKTNPRDVLAGMQLPGFPVVPKTCMSPEVTATPANLKYGEAFVYLQGREPPPSGTM